MSQLPELPRPACTYADHSYPAFNKRQMEEYANDAIAKIRLSSDEVQAIKDAIHGIDYQCGVSPRVAVVLRALLGRQP